ncbi:MAG: hypothetical protein CMK07_05240 [Ponticaulis sp.]|nr:hypothetical protein [Ponticaulis sp.]
MATGLGVLTGLIMLALNGAHDDAPRQARAHVHGMGEALVVVEGESLFLEISAPKANFVSADGEAITFGASTELSMSDSAFPVSADDILSLPNSAKCSVSDVTLALETVDGGHDAHDDHDAHEHDDDHAEHDHDADHADHDDDMHDEHAHDDHDEDVGHANILLTLEASCSAVSKMKSLEFTLFETWPGFENLNTTVLTDSATLAETLTATNAKIDLD